MQYTIQHCSPRALQRITTKKSKLKTFKNYNPLVKYPLDELEIGEAFAIPFANEIERKRLISVLSATCGQKSKVSGKRFACLLHRDLGCYEVARIDDREVYEKLMQPAKEQKAEAYDWQAKLTELQAEGVTE